MKVVVMIPTKDTVHPRAIDAVYGQNYDDYSVLVSCMAPIRLHPDPEKDRYLNGSRNRNYLRQMALASDAEWFLSVDSDTVIPKNAITEFLKVGKPLMGGWYPKFDGKEWVAGKMIANGVCYTFQEPQPGIIPVDMVGMGCAMIHRSLLEKLPFDGGVEQNIRNPFGQVFFQGECLVFGLGAEKLGFQPYMLPNIICEHIPFRFNRNAP